MEASHHQPGTNIEAPLPIPTGASTIPSPGVAATDDPSIKSPFSELVAPHSNLYSDSVDKSGRMKQESMERFRELCNLRTLHLDYQLTLLQTPAAENIMLSRLTNCRRKEKNALALEVITLSTAAKFIATEIARLEVDKALVQEAPGLFTQFNPKEARKILITRSRQADSDFGEALLSPRHYSRMQQILTQSEASSSKQILRSIRSLENKIAEHYLPLMYSIIQSKLTVDSHAQRPDVIQNSYLVLIDCVRTYKPESGFAFQSYLHKAVVRKIWQTLAEDRQTIGIPIYITQNLIPIYEKARQQFQVPRPSEEQIAFVANCSLERARQIVEKVELRDQALNVAGGLGHRGDQENGPSIQVADKNRYMPASVALDSQEQHPRLIVALRSLKRVDPRLVRLVTKRLGLKDGQEHTLAELSSQEGITSERIRQLLLRAYQLLANHQKLQGLC